MFSLIILYHAPLLCYRARRDCGSDCTLPGARLLENHLGFDGYETTGGGGK